MPDVEDTDERIGSIPLLAAFREDADESVTPPPVEWIAATARRRGRRRATATGVAAGVAVAALAATVFTVAGRPSQPVDPAEPARPTAAPTTPASPVVSPSPTASRSPSAPTAPTTGSSGALRSTPATTPTTPPGAGTMDPSPGRPTGTTGAPTTPPEAFAPEDVDWPNATITLPADTGGSGCPARRVTLRAGRAVVAGTQVGLIAVKSSGDLTRDGVSDAVLHVLCKGTGELDSGDGSGNLLVATRRDGALVGVGHVGPVGENYGPARVRDGRLVATVEQRYGTSVQERTYRWNGDRFAQVGGPTAFPS